MLNILKGILIFLGILVLLGVLIGGGVYSWKYAPESVKADLGIPSSGRPVVIIPGESDAQKIARLTAERDAALKAAKGDAALAPGVAPKPGATVDTPAATVDNPEVAATEIDPRCTATDPVWSNELGGCASPPQ